jgi:hypothetical protein
VHTVPGITRTGPTASLGHSAPAAQPGKNLLFRPCSGLSIAAVPGSDRVGCAARSGFMCCELRPFPRSLPPNPAGIFQCTGLSSDCAAFATGPGPFLPRSRRTSSTVPASCITHTSRFLIVRSPVPLRPVVRLSRSPELAGRYSCDYYGHSVAIVLAATLSAHRSAAFGVRVLAAVDGDGAGWRAGAQVVRLPGWSPLRRLASASMVSSSSASILACWWAACWAR